MNKIRCNKGVLSEDEVKKIHDTLSDFYKNAPENKEGNEFQWCAKVYDADGIAKDYHIALVSIDWKKYSDDKNSYKTYWKNMVCLFDENHEIIGSNMFDKGSGYQHQDFYGILENDGKFYLGEQISVDHMHNLPKTSDYFIRFHPIKVMEDLWAKENGFRKLKVLISTPTAYVHDRRHSEEYDDPEPEIYKGMYIFDYDTKRENTLLELCLMSEDKKKQLIQEFHDRLSIYTEEFDRGI